jgi:hypothetical protein
LDVADSGDDVQVAAEPGDDGAQRLQAGDLTVSIWLIRACDTPAASASWVCVMPSYLRISAS